MGYGDAYLYAVILKDCNVEEYVELRKMFDDLHEIINREYVVDRKERRKRRKERCKFHRDGYNHKDKIEERVPCSMRKWHLYDILINGNYPWDINADDRLLHDNLVLEHVSDDGWLESYHAVSKLPIVCKVGYFIDNYKGKAWIPSRFEEFRDNWMTIVGSHYDTHEEFLEGFKVKEVRNDH